LANVIFDSVKFQKGPSFRRHH